MSKKDFLDKNDTPCFFAWLSLLVFLFFSVAKAQTLVAENPETVVANFYRAAKGGGNFRTLDTRLISDELHALFRLAWAVEKRSEAEIAASHRPTDKPRRLEGAVLTPYYEGYSEVLAIGNVRAGGRIGMADVKLVNDRESPPLAWTDTAVLVWEGGWKIDDILFRWNEPAAAGEGVKKMLSGFVGIDVEWYYKGAPGPFSTP